jgi:hypothetical protein
MAKCKRCGKGGLFYKVEQNGFCKECNRIVGLEAQEQKLILNIEHLESESSNFQKSYEDIKERRDTLHNEIAEKAKRDALVEIAD